MRRNIKVYKRQRGDKDVVSNLNVSDDASIAAYPYIISNYRITLSGASKLHSYSDTVVHSAILTNNRLIVYGYVPAMNQNQTFADCGVPPDLYPGFERATPKQPSGEEWMTPALINAEHENPPEIYFPDCRAKQIPEPHLSVVPIEIGIYYIGEHSDHYG